MDKELFDDLVTSLNEAIEYEKGNIKLKSTVAEVSDDDDISFMYNQLPDDIKQAIRIIIANALIRR